MQELLITREGFERLNKQLERLKGDERRRVADRLRRAVSSEANLAQNAEYLDAREEKLQLEQRILLLKGRLRSARIVAPRLGNGRVDPGERVRVREVTSGQSLELELVGLRKGEIAVVDAPRGKFGFEVLAVEVPAHAA
jgi:transcription elongation factor GreA